MVLPSKGVLALDHVLQELIGEFAGLPAVIQAVCHDPQYDSPEKQENHQTHIVHHLFLEREIVADGLMIWFCEPGGSSKKLRNATAWLCCSSLAE